MLYLFEDYGLDTDRRELYRATSPISVEPKVFDLLAYVVRNRERVVSKEDLVAAIWHGRIVSDSALTTCINAARNAIGDSGEAQRLIKTLPRKGIRFVGVVREEQKPAAALAVTTPGPSRSSIAGADKPSIAVLPFANMSGDPEQEYFSDGITEDIIIDLSKVSALEVLSRNTTFSFKGKTMDGGQIGQQLRVGFIVEGSVRKAGGRVRITAQLIDAHKDSHLWAERYDRELSDIFALQGEISRAIVAALKIKLLPQESQAIESRSTQSPEAYRLYLLARYYRAQYSARFQEIALRFCWRALEIDPSYARAWALAGLCQASLYQRGRSAESGLAAAEKALSLDSSLAEAHATKGRALSEIGRLDEALIANKESLRLEPDSYAVRMNFAQTCLWLGRNEEAVMHYERAAQLVETDYLSVSMAAWCYFELGRKNDQTAALRRALEREEREIALRPDNGHALAMGACELAELGEHERAKEWASRSLIIDPDDIVSRYNITCAMARMNELDRALDLLEAYARDMPLPRINRIKQDGSLQSLRGHPRFQALVAQAEARWAAAQRAAGSI